MSIAEKLTTVAENQQKVYDAGHKAAVNRYCPDSIETDSIVTCKPVGGYPLGIISQITPIQAGSGDASPTNIRPITGHTAVKVTIANDTESAEYNTELGQAVYAGTFDWSTGLLTLTHKLLTITGEESGWNKSETHIINYNYCNDSRAGRGLYGWCSHVQHNASGYIAEGTVNKGYAGGYLMFDSRDGYWPLPANTADEMLAYVKAQNAAGTPLQILYELETYTTIQLTPQEILALSGTNTIQSDTGDTTVKGKCDPLDEFVPLVQTIPLADLMFGYGVSASLNTSYEAYVSANSNRTICPYFIPIDAGGTYRLDWEGDTSVKIGIESYNSSVTHRVALGSSYSSSEIKDHGWGSSGGASYTVTIPKTINGNPAETIRVMFNAGSGVTGDITITKIK